MIKDNLFTNDNVRANTDFINRLRSAFPEFVITKENKLGISEEENFDFNIEKFKSCLKENNINELEDGFQLSFIGKDYAKKQAGERPTTVVTPDEKHNIKDINKDSKNLFFTGDNLEVLRHLQNNYFGMLDIIYIDPPYNTGNDGFVYPDKFEYDDRVLKDVFGLNDKELDRLKSIQGRSTHSAWLSFMYPRISLGQKLLKDSGILFVSIDEYEIANLMGLLDEIFGEQNRIENFIWIKNSTKNLSSTTSTNHEYVLCYSKSLVIVESNQMFRVSKPGLDKVNKILKRASEDNLSIIQTETLIRRF